MPTRDEFASAIAARLDQERDRLAAEFRDAQPTRRFVLDELLPAEWLHQVSAAFPAADQLLLKRSLREHKRVGVSVEDYGSILGALLYAFQAPSVVAAMTAITGIDGLAADPTLYASGISIMGPGDFLNPHIDNSHDGDQRRYRVLNLLLYATPDWQLDDGGNLELWERRAGRLKRAEALPASFNRLIVMETGPQSWHSVDRITGQGSRCCVSNYYFAERASTGGDYRHVTTFAGRPNEPVKRLLLAADGVARNAIGRALPGLLKRGPHRRSRVDGQVDE